MVNSNVNQVLKEAVSWMKNKGLDWVREEVSYWAHLERRVTEKLYKKEVFHLLTINYYLLTILHGGTLTAYILLPEPL